MRFRFKALGIHLLASASALTLILGSLYVGWYHWPGWHLADVAQVVTVMVGVDVVVGPLLTFVVANPGKPRRELKRDVAIIVVIQLCALIYGSASLWRGRPLYYAFSESVLQMVQAYDIDAKEAELGLQQNPQLAPHWYSLPRWIAAPLPQDADERAKIVGAVIGGGDDVISMPRYYKPWTEGLPALKTHLKKVDAVGYFMPKEKKALKEQMRAAGLNADEPNAMPLTGRGKPLLAVFDTRSLKLTALFAVK
jgi:hypothetical protein